MRIFVVIILVMVFTGLLWMIEHKISSKVIKISLKFSLISVYVILMLWSYLDNRLPKFKELGAAVIVEDFLVYGELIYVFWFREPIKRARHPHLISSRSSQQSGKMSKLAYTTIDAHPDETIYGGRLSFNEVTVMLKPFH